VVSNRPYAAQKAAQEYGRRFGCEEGFRDAKWWLGFAKARIAQIKAWSRMFALFAIAMLAMISESREMLGVMPLQVLPQPQDPCPDTSA
jgi:hypothetical protein